MSSNKQRRQKLNLAQAAKRAAQQAEEAKARLAALRAGEAARRAKLLPEVRGGRVIPVNPSKIVSRSCLPYVPDFYRDSAFTCRDCGKEEVWTAIRQKWWYEEMGGEIESIAIRCRACRQKERKRRETARRIHLEGLAKKQSRRTKP